MLQSILRSASTHHRIHHQLQECYIGPTVFTACPNRNARQLLFRCYRAHVLVKANMWLPPHFQNYINATLAGEEPSGRLQFPDNGVVILCEFSFSSTLETEEEPSISISEPYSRKNGEDKWHVYARTLTNLHFRVANKLLVAQLNCGEISFSWFIRPSHYPRNIAATMIDGYFSSLMQVVYVYASRKCIDNTPSVLVPQ